MPMHCSVVQAAHAARERTQAAARVVGGSNDESGSDFSLEEAAAAEDDEGLEDEEEEGLEDDEAWWVAGCSPELSPGGELPSNPILPSNTILSLCVFHASLCLTCALAPTAVVPIAAIGAGSTALGW
jgi:hypothetical protein